MKYNENSVKFSGKSYISWVYMEVIRLSGKIVMDISLGGEMIIW